MRLVQNYDRLRLALAPEKIGREPTIQLYLGGDAVCDKFESTFQSYQVDSLRNLKRST
jgi:hypothetical protein